ncbi:hypothetical protein L6164_018830 [Bauhinia variegata]|uniref:Uncharacterized protein n=1 Tax=Bauhinia variegata TaxID=167791 RepID=A0ACB9NDI9_BAUVA|nr:hypothetical protein L6164_018830 [Bauhinia variegata]
MDATVGPQESGCLLSSMPSDAMLDRTSAIGFICDLNDNILAPWPSTSYELDSSCNRTTKLPSLPTAISAQNGFLIENLLLSLFLSSLLYVRILH